MIPIQELLNRIRWDRGFDGEFVLGYDDHLAEGIVRVPLREVTFPTGDHFAFELIDADGMTHSIPYHRVREVLRNGELIWQRRGPDRGRHPSPATS